MLKSVFEYRDYKNYLKTRVTARGRGEKSRIAEALRCHLAYISQVLNGTAQLSPEQADTLNGYLGHADDEAEYFLLLVNHARAGTDSLRKVHETRIRKTFQERTLLENRLKNKKTLPFEAQATYYSVWYYSAIHLLISVPGFQTKEAIARHLRLPLPLVAQALTFLVGTGLAALVKGHYQTGQASLHLANDSPWIARHHASWRMQAVQAIDRQDLQNHQALHYTSVISMSPDDSPEVRKIMIEAIEKIRTVVRQSPEKSVYCYNLDLFPV
jgi:uncharacterized protein (TIGR02147 family)